MSHNSTASPAAGGRGGRGGGAPLTPQQQQMRTLKRLGEHEFPLYTWYMIGGVVGLATLHNLLCTLWAWRRRRLHKSSLPASSHESNVLSFRFARAVSTLYTRVIYRWRIPQVPMTILEVVLTVAYIAVLFSLEFSYTQDLTVALWANRAGHLAGIQFPLIVALGAKHNVIGFLTGLSHEKLNLMHRMTSRVNLVLTWVHMLGTLRDRGLKRWLHAPWVTCGMVAGVAMTLLVLTSFAPIRRRFYEFFYACHMILVIITMICTMIHCYEPHYGIYIWPSFVFWGFDRLCRYLRLVSFNSFFISRKCTATVELASTDTLRLTIKRHIPFGWRPGQHMFLAFPSVNPLQSHPFTIGTAFEGSRFSFSEKHNLEFVVRVRNGLTKSLYDRVLETGSIDLPILVDGPYGAPPDITPFSTCIFVTGGSGVTFTLPRCEDVIRRAREGNACVQRVVFIWAIRDKSHLKWVPDRLAALASSVPPGVSLSIQIYITSPTPSVEELEKNPSEDPDKRSSQASDDKKSDIRSLDEGHDAIMIHEGRPDILKLLEAEVKESNGPVSVDASGPSALLATVRSVLCAPFAGPVSVLKGAKTVQLNVEEFSM